MHFNELSPEFRRQIDDYWKAASLMATKPIYLYDNPLLQKPPPTAEPFLQPFNQGHFAIDFSLLKLAKPTH
jgi:phosphoketolase